MKSVLSGLIGMAVEVSGGKKFPLGLRGVITRAGMSGYNLMITFKDSEGVERESVDYNLSLSVAPTLPNSASDCPYCERKEDCEKEGVCLGFMRKE